MKTLIFLIITIIILLIALFLYLLIREADAKKAGPWLKETEDKQQERAVKKLSKR